jgi:hypothetical protein
VAAVLLVDVVEREQRRVRPADLVPGAQARQHPLARHPVVRRRPVGQALAGRVGVVPAVDVVRRQRGPSREGVGAPVLVDAERAEGRGLGVRVGRIDEGVEPSVEHDHVVLHPHQVLRVARLGPRGVEPSGPAEVGRRLDDAHAGGQPVDRLRIARARVHDADDAEVDRGAVVHQRGEAVGQAVGDAVGDDPEHDPATFGCGNEHGALLVGGRVLRA